jgi:two-component system cell cycle sensor histidine kinase/response regulator CckA
MEANANILIVDDEPALLKMMGLYLKRVGYQVTALDGSDRAWAEVEATAGDFAAAVLDATLRGMTSEALALKLLAANPSLCVVVASGYPVDMSAMEAAGPGRVSFVQKPFTAEALVRTLRRLIGPEEKNL